MYENFQREQAWPQNHGAIPPSATTFLPDGTRIASAGNQIFKAPPEETWHGFLYHLAATAIGSDWFAAELRKPIDQRHILTSWYLEVCEAEGDSRGHFTRWKPEMDTGATLAFRSVAYDIFCMMQSMNLSPKLLARLRHPDQFEGARYELWVAAALSKANFAIEYLDEDDRSSKHGECIATYRPTGERYWIEAKRRHRPNVNHKEVLARGEQLKVDAGLVAEAMKKPADHPRIVFIDLNIPPWAGHIAEAPWIKAFRKSLNLLERQRLYRGREDQRAFVLATNHPYHYVSDTTPDPRQHFIGTAFNMPSLDPGKLHVDHPTIIALMQSITQHFAIPDAFLDR